MVRKAGRPTFLQFIDYLLRTKVGGSLSQLFSIEILCQCYQLLD